MTSLNRRSFLRLSGAGLGTAGLAACAGTGESPSPDGAGASAGPVDTVTFWSNHPGGSKEVEQQLIDAFTEESGIAVRMVDGGANYEELAQKYNAALSGGELPDVIVASDVTWFNLALNDTLAPMDDLWEQVDVDTEGYVESLREDYEFDGQHFALPYSRSTPLFYYNKELWAAAGLEDRGPETWQEFAEWAPALLEANGGKAPMALADGSNYLDWYFQGMAWAFGGAYSEEWEPKFTDPATIEAGQFLQEQVRAGHIQISNDPASQFSSGQAACLLESTGTLGGLADTATFEYGTAFLPGPPPACPTGGAGLAIANGIDDARKEAAMKFIAFMTNTDNTVTFSQATGYMPVRADAIDTDETQAYLEENPNFRTALEQLPLTQSQDYARVFVPGGGARIGAALDRITTGGEDVETVFAALAEETTTVYERDIEPKL